jgi:hypothetical protein
MRFTNRLPGLGRLAGGAMLCRRNATELAHTAVCLKVPRRSACSGKGGSVSRSRAVAETGSPIVVSTHLHQLALAGNSFANAGEKCWMPLPYF